MTGIKTEICRGAVFALNRVIEKLFHFAIKSVQLYIMQALMLENKKRRRRWFAEALQMNLNNIFLYLFNL